MEDEILVKVDRLSKKFCRSLQLSLFYGIKDLGREFLLGAKNISNYDLDIDCQLRKSEFWALKDVSFELKRGECIGLIGRNGAGKTTLLKMLNGLIKPDRGYIKIRGQVGALIALGAGFNQVLTGRENIFINGSILGLCENEIKRKFDEIVDFSGLNDFIDSPVQSYSSGMQVKLGFAIATAIKPDVLILDEVLAVGDAGFRAKCYERIDNLKKDCAVLFVSHAMHHVARICSKTMVLEKGLANFYGNVAQGIEIYERLCLSGSESSTPRSSSLTFQHKSVKILDFISINGISCSMECVTSLELDQHESICVEVSLVASEDLSDLVLDLVFQDLLRGETIAEASNFQLDSNLVNFVKYIPLKIRLFVNPILLNSGTYSLSFIIASKNHMTHYLWIRNFVQLRVFGSRGIAPVQLRPKITVSCVDDIS